jgi:glutamine synthetase
MIALNTAVADQLRKFKQDVSERIRKKSVKKDEAILQVLRKYIVESKKVRFEGNGYCQEWLDEAAKRGLTNIKEAPEALKSFVSEKTKKLFTENKVLSERELEARYEIRLEIYTKKIQIESRMLGDLAINHVIPTALHYQNMLLENIRGLKELLSPSEFNRLAEHQLLTLRQISENITDIRNKAEDMLNERKQANSEEDIRVKTELYSKRVKPYLDEIREHIDRLELIVDDEFWPLPKYREMLFTR